MATVPLSSPYAHSVNSSSFPLISTLTPQLDSCLCTSLDAASREGNRDLVTRYFSPLVPGGNGSSPEAAGSVRTPSHVGCIPPPVSPPAGLADARFPPGLYGAVSWARPCEPSATRASQGRTQNQWGHWVQPSEQPLLQKQVRALTGSLFGVCPSL